MLFAMLVNGGPYQYQGSDTAWHFTRAALDGGHEVLRVFFYHDGANNGNRLAVPPQDERNVGARWSRLAEERGLDLVVCVAAGQRRGILDAAERDRHGKDADVLAPGFRIAGLGLLAEAAILADRFVTFGG